MRSLSSASLALAALLASTWSCGTATEPPSDAGPASAADASAAGGADAATEADGGADPGFVGSCDFPGQRCTDVYVDPGVSPASVAGIVASTCVSRSGNPGQSPCPTANRVGTCSANDAVQTDGGAVPVHAKDRIYSTSTAAATAPTECANHGGVWAAD